MAVGLVAAFGAALLIVALPGAQADPPSPSEAAKIAAGPKPTPMPRGPYGSDTYYSSDAEEADLGRVAELADSVHAVGSARTGVDSMIIRVPRGARLPKDTVVGAFTVHFLPSRFTRADVRSLDRRIVAAGNAAAATGEKSCFGGGYNAEKDLEIVHGTLPPQVTALSAPGLLLINDPASPCGRL